MRSVSKPSARPYFFRLVSSFTRSLTPLDHLETTRLEKLVRLLAARRQTDEYETSYDDF